MAGEGLTQPVVINQLIIIKGSELEEVKNPINSTFLGYVEDGLDSEGNQKYKSVRISFKDMVPLFGVTQETGSSLTLVPSQKLFTDTVDELATKTDIEGNDVVYAPNGIIEFPDTSGLAPLINEQGKIVIYGDRTEYIGATNITGNESVGNENVVINIDSVLPRDTKIKEISFNVLVYLSDADFIFGVFKKEGNSIKCTQRYSFRVKSAGKFIFQTNDETIHPKGSYVGFFRGNRVSMGFEALKTTKSYLAKRDADVGVGSVLDITSTSNDLFAYSFKMDNPLERDIAKNILSNSSFKFFKNGTTFSEFRQSPTRAEFITNISNSGYVIDNNYYIKNSGNNYDMTFSINCIRTYDLERQTYCSVNFIFNNGDKLELGRINENSNMGVWFKTLPLANVHNKYLLPTSVRVVNDKDSNTFKMYFNDVLVLSNSSYTKHAYVQVRNGSTGNRYYIDIIDNDFKGINLVKTGIDLNQAVSFTRHKNYVITSYINKSYNLELAVVDLLTYDKKIKTFTNITSGYNRHNYYAVIVDKNENIHIVGGSHASGYKYLYGSLSDINTISEKTSILNSGQFTYPELLLLNDGRLIFITRIGSSSVSSYRIYEYDYSTGDFSPLVNNIVDGNNQGAYCSLWTKFNDWYYTTFTWRDNAHTTGVLRNGQVLLIKTQNFVDYFDPKGNLLTLPVKRLVNSDSCLIDDVPYGVGLHNQWGIIPFVWNNKLMVWYTKQNEHGYFNVFIASPNDVGDYETKQITQFTATEDFIGGNGMGTYFDACVRNCGEYLEFSYFFAYTGFRTLKLDKLLEVISDEPYIYDLPKTGNQKRETIWRELFNDCTIIDTSDKVLAVDITPSTQDGNIIII